MKTTSKTNILTILISAVILTAMPSGALAYQAGDDQPTRPAVERSESQRREMAKRMIEARLERIRAEQASLEATLAAIESGQPLEQLRLPEPQRRGDWAGRDDRRGPDAGPDRQRDEAEPAFTDAQVLEFIAEVYPEWMGRINELKERDPEGLQRLLRERRPRLMELMIERRDNPEVFQVRQRIARSELGLRRAAWAFARAGTDSQRATAESELTSILESQFDLRVELARAELRSIQRAGAQKLAAIEETIAKRAELIAERKADLLQAIRDRRPPQPGRDGVDRPGRPGDRDRPRPEGPPRR